MMRNPPRSTLSSSSAASDVYKRQVHGLRRDCVMSVSLCLIVWNELEGCKKDVPLIPRECFDEIYAVDGGSTDGTVEYLESQSIKVFPQSKSCLLYTSPSPRDRQKSRMPSSA
eukprot:TRINITY_DN12699_c0_g2_i1.p1 TRINITY_DN12699_c0_g2~~TRINITY_DN12699_c0_g2_i1.p1  ORF type:complete len:113 (+),score=22.78 TRINITY_DN12699_c0_g2_i1:3-341(+)